MNNNNFDYIFKFILIGETNVGKSALLMQFIYSRFKGEYDPTIGIEFGSKTIEINKYNIKLQIWDTAGQESFRSITRSYYRGSICAFLIFDITKRNTFTGISKWLKETKEYANEKILIFLIGNKIDLESEREVTREEAEIYAKKNNLFFLELSAKYGTNVQEAFQMGSEEVLKKIENGEINPMSDNYGIKICRELKGKSMDGKKNSDTQKGMCCSGGGPSN